jgi:hypothetical protein
MWKLCGAMIIYLDIVFVQKEDDTRIVIERHLMGFGEILKRWHVVACDCDRSQEVLTKADRIELLFIIS